MGTTQDSKDHSYKIKIKTNKDTKNKRLIKDIKEAVGSDTRIEEEENCIIVYISATQSLDKKQIKSVLKDVMAGKKVDSNQLAKKSKKEAKKAKKEEKAAKKEKKKQKT